MIQSDLKRRGFMFVLSSPSGAGKTTLSRLLKQHDNNLVMSISSTTRQARPNEKHGEDYFFIDEKEFEEKIDQKFFYEYAEVFGNYYGTPRKKVEDSLENGTDVLFDIDWQGTRRLTSKARDDIVSIFILPPSLKELERRLVARGQDNKEVIERRMARASDEISHWDEYDHVIINDNLDASLQSILYILKAERLRRKRQHGLASFVNEMLLKK
ncbi:guanylate kinase [Rickettsiales bacterium]|nr:guanylate kinase [Rickettsiales bacterium]